MKCPILISRIYSNIYSCEKVKKILYASCFWFFSLLLSSFYLHPISFSSHPEVRESKAGGEFFRQACKFCGSQDDFIKQLKIRAKAWSKRFRRVD
jgi:hypothetical protein